MATIKHAFTSAIADDATAAAAGEVLPSHWNAAHTVSLAPADITSVSANSVLANNTGSTGAATSVTLAASQLVGMGASGSIAAITLGTGLSMTGATLNGPASGAGLTANTFTDTQTVAMGTITTAKSPVAITETRNAGGVVFPGISYTVTDTASAAGSSFVTMLKGASTQFNVSTLGKISFGNTGTGYIDSSSGFVLKIGFTNSSLFDISYDGSNWKLPNGVAYSWAGSDAGIGRNAAGIVEINSTSAGTFRDLKLRNLLASGGNGSYVQTPSMTVANLAAAATAGNGARAYVTDSTLVFNGTNVGTAVTGGGANHNPVVVVNGTWVIGC